MPYTPVELMLIKGYPSSTSLGNPNVTDLQPTSIDLLSGVFTVFDENGKSTFSPVIANIKNGGVWIDSATMEGRQLVAAQKGNVLETILLRAAQTQTVMHRAVALSRLNTFAAAASDFWTSGGIGDPVYLRFRAPGAPGEQYALIYSIELDDDDDGLNPEGNGTLTMTIEREPAWRGLPPGMNPKVWALLARGQKPSSAAGGLAADQFNYANLHLTSAGSGNNTHLLNATCKRVDEIGTSNVDYVTVPAADIPGDAPALCWIHASSLASGVSKIYLSRSTWRDFFPSTNTNAVNQKLRNTFNGGDSTLVGGGNLTASKQVDATNGALSNGSIVTRYILRAANLAAGFSETTWATWTRTINHYARRWMVFARMRVSAGTAANHTLRVGLKVQNETVYTAPRPLSGLTSSFSLFYCGVVDASGIPVRVTDGIGLGITYGAVLSALLTKTNDGVASTVELVDFILLPLDEPTLKINDVVFSTGSADSSGYFAFETTPYGLTAGGTDRADASGQPLTLQPGKDNRIYYLDDYVGSNFQTGVITFYVDIVPRWFGIRDV